MALRAKIAQPMEVYSAAEDFELALIVSLLSRKPLNAPLETDADEKMALLRSIGCISRGSEYSIANGMLRFVPGTLVGGSMAVETHDICSVLRPLMVLSPFLKSSIRLSIKGITNDRESIDLFKITFHTLFRLFGVGGFELDIKKRGFAPDGGGSVIFRNNAVRTIKSIDLSEREELRKIRGVVITARIGSEFSHRMIREIKAQMSDLANTKVLCIVNNRNDSGPSPGYECSVVAESRHGLFFSTCNTKELPERMAKRCCHNTLKSIRKGGLLDSKLLPYAILYMGLAKGVSSLRVGTLDLLSQRVLEFLKDFFGISHRITKAEEDNVLTVVGCGYTNPFMPL